LDVLLDYQFERALSIRSEYCRSVRRTDAPSGTSQPFAYP
jgi:hypothetical protein